MTAAPLTSAVPVAPGQISAGRVLGRTCAAEWTRLWSVKTTWWCLVAAAVIMVGLGAVAGFDAAGDPVPPRGEPAWQVGAIATMPAQFVLLALALTAVTADYATGGIVPTLQWTTRRTTLFLARSAVLVAVATGLGVLLALASALTAFGTARPLLTLPVREGLDALSTVGLVVAGGTALAVGLGFLLRGVAASLVAVFVLMLVLPVLLPQLGFGWTSELARSLPGSGAAFLLVGELPGMTRTSAVTTLLGWAGGALLLGWLRLTRQDANR